MFTQALIGGILIGIAVLLIAGGLGRVMGISGIIKGIIPKAEHDTSWRYLFLIGLILGAIIYRLYNPESSIETLSPSYILYAVSGIFVGLGISLANGCTSGHAVCGISRFSLRSVVATLTFMTTAVLTVSLISHIF